MAQTEPVKYVFLDVVKFTEGRSVEAQADIVNAINEIVRSTLAAIDMSEDRVILLPTGDGLCIALLNIEEPFDVHLLLATDVIRRVSEHSASQKDKTRTFTVRIGINANVDNVVTDINGRRNVAGAGINLAARVMSVADGNQIIIGQSVYEILRHREKYLKAFRAYSANVKHGVRLPVYQLISDSSGLNVGVPQAFAPKPKVEPQFDRAIAYYVGLANAFAPLLPPDETPGCVLWLWYTANDLLESETAYADADPSPRTFGATKGMTPEQQIEYYSSLYFSIRWDFAELIWQKYLDPFYKYFESGRYGLLYHRPLPAAIEKVKAEFPDIWAKFTNDGA